MKITSKREFFELWEAGVLGNRTRLWRDPETAFQWALNIVAEKQWKSGTLGAPPPDVPEIGFREIRKLGSAGAGAWEKVPWHRVLETAARWKAAGRDFVMDDGAPDYCRTMQGEVVRTERGLGGFLDLVGKLPMRPARAAGHMKPYGYLQTRVLLERYMDPSSRDDLDALLDRYPDAAVEFSCFSRNVGVFPHRNTLFWEVRNY